MDNTLHSIVTIFMLAYIYSAIQKNYSTQVRRKIDVGLLVSSVVILSLVAVNASGDWRVDHIPSLSTASERQSLQFRRELRALVTEIKQTAKSNHYENLPSPTSFVAPVEVSVSDGHKSATYSPKREPNDRKFCPHGTVPVDDGCAIQVDAVQANVKDK